ncbi:MAG: hypothetical protein HS111_21810 [Kofleriaceae bacterium]|nr:hypothetical protein [Kofleriaceae bacterium]MCL4227914.1 hypothetical protein [Myxococcales bacterium]
MLHRCPPAPRSILAALVAAALPLAGCFHVNLGAPPPRTAPAAERMTAYERLRPAGELHTFRAVATGTHSARLEHTQELVLADGSIVRHADDLLPVVADDSVAAAAARRSGSARRNKMAWMIGGAVAAAAGTILVWRGFDQNHEHAFDDTHPGNGKIKLGVAIGLGGALVGTLGATHQGWTEARERRAAFIAYDAGLRQQLALCVDGLRLVDCAAEPGLTPDPVASPASAGQDAAPAPAEAAPPAPPAADATPPAADATPPAAYGMPPAPPMNGAI